MLLTAIVTSMGFYLAINYRSKSNNMQNTTRLSELRDEKAKTAPSAVNIFGNEKIYESN